MAFESFSQFIENLQLHHSRFFNLFKNCNFKLKNTHILNDLQIKNSTKQDLHIESSYRVIT